MKNEVLAYLKEDARFRERRNKNIGLANLIMRKYGIEIPREKRDDIVADILAGDRNWRQILSEEPSYRGTDYSTKDIVEQRAEIKLGYEVGYHEDIHRLMHIDNKE